METKEILENNKLIAEFMGGKYDKDTTFPIHPNDLWLPIHGIVNYTTIESGKIMLYHVSWDWLMPVVEKIERLNYWVRIQRNHILIEYFGNSYEAKNKGLYFINTKQSGKDKMSITYQAVIEFIKFYNSNK